MADNPEMAVCLFPEAGESVVSRFKAAAQLHVLVSVHENTLLNVWQVSHLLKRSFSMNCQST